MAAPLPVAGLMNLLFYLVKIEPRRCLPFSARVLLLGEEDVLAHWTVSGARAMTNDGSIAASFSIGVRPRSAIEKRS